MTFFSLHLTNSRPPLGGGHSLVLASPLSCPQAVFLKPALQPLGYPAKVWPSAGLDQPRALSLFYILYKPLLSNQLSVSNCTWARRRSEWFWHICDIILFSFPPAEVCHVPQERKEFFFLAWNDWWILLTNGFKWKARWLDGFLKKYKTISINEKIKVAGEHVRSWSVVFPASKTPVGPEKAIRKMIHIRNLFFFLMWKVN